MNRNMDDVWVEIRRRLSQECREIWKSTEVGVDLESLEKCADLSVFIRASLPICGTRAWIISPDFLHEPKF